MTDGQIVSWMASRRMEKRKGTLPAWKAKRLDQIPKWEWDPQGHYRTPEEWVPIAEKLAQDNGGLLPRSSWITGNGYTSLPKCIADNPGLFAHILRTAPYFTPLREWVVRAEELAAQHGGVLPTQRWLKDHGHGGICRAISNSREAFTHIPQSKLTRTPQEWASAAERIAQENNGVLPLDFWLSKNGYRGLPFNMRKYPEYFKHIRQETSRTPMEELVQIAMHLAEGNEGVLPSISWLRRHGHEDVVSAMRHHPQEFEGVKQERLLRRPEEWVPVVEKLSQENGGMIPSTAWLRKHDYEAAMSAMRNHPDLFAHLQRRRDRTRLHEWVEFAKKLTSENGGILPMVTELQREFPGLCDSIRDNPSAFSGIPQKRCNPHGYLVAIRGGGGNGQRIARRLGVSYENRVA